jgi:hypothetical protein
MSDKVELQLDQPVTVAFKYRQGKLCEKKWPGAEDCYARQTDDGRMIFVDADLEARLLKACPKPGTRVVLTLSKTSGGSKYITIKSAAPQIKQPMGVHEGGHGKSWPNRLKTPNPLPDAKYAQPEAAPDPGWADLGATMPEVSSLAQQISAAPDCLLGRCLCEALDACKVAQEHAASIGVPVVFTSGDIERMGVSVFIERTRNGSVYERKPAGRQHSNGVEHASGRTQ